MNPLMSTCQCGCSETGEVFYCLSCDIKFKCEDEYDVHKRSQKFKKWHRKDDDDIRVIENSLMSACRCGHCEPGKAFLCKNYDLTVILNDTNPY